MWHWCEAEGWPSLKASMYRSIERLLVEDLERGSPCASSPIPTARRSSHQAVGGRVRIIERARGGAESTSNVMALRSLLLDSNASGVTSASRDLLGAAFQQTNLVIDSNGLSKVVKLDQRRSLEMTLAMAPCLLAAGSELAVLLRSNCGPR